MVTNQSQKIAPQEHLRVSLEHSMSDALAAVANSQRCSGLNLIRTSSHESNRGAGSGVKLRLAEKLQTSLDIESLLNCFDECLTAQTNVDGVHYVHDLAKVNILIGKSAEHNLQCNLVTPSELVGNLRIMRSTPFTDNESEIIKSLVDLLVYPLRNALKYREALTAALKDPLTGAGNRIALTSILHHEIEMNKRYTQNLAVLMLDMDNFKNINDMFGHTQGDEVLISTVEMIKYDIRASDDVFRYGGEEFVVLLPNTPLREATHIAERLRARIANLTLEQDGIKIITTTSIGITMLRQEDDYSSLLQRADQAMYQAKNAGRNQVVVAETDV